MLRTLRLKNVEHMDQISSIGMGSFHGYYSEGENRLPNYNVNDFLNDVTVIPTFIN